MKTILLSSLLSLLVACSGALSAQSLLIHYAFNDANTATTTATDSSGNGRDASITNWNGTSAQVPAALQTATGVSGKAGDYAFDNTGAAGMGGFGNRGGQVRWTGTGAGETIGDLTSFTITWWFKTPENVIAGNGARAVTLHNAATSDGTAYVESRFENNGVGRTVVTGSSTRDTPANTYGLANTWTFVAITFDGTATESERIKFYVGGLNTSVSLVGSYASTLTSIALGSTTNVLTLGGYNQGSGQTPFQAVMDDFRLYSGTLDTSALNDVRLDAIAIPEPATAALVTSLIALVVMVATGRYFRRNR
ncbi:MAG: LamG domain-containing protein [Opitutaceae bacterium]|jgi:hypothetical protein|nr:LamG domain-containing protein [Opitutaceae bacterium]